MSGTIPAREYLWDEEWEEESMDMGVDVPVDVPYYRYKFTAEVLGLNEPPSRTATRSRSPSPLELGVPLLALS